MSKENEAKLEKIQTIKDLIAQHDYEKAEGYYNDLPESFKKEKLAQLIHVRICSNLDHEKYIRSLLEFKSLYPNDPNIFLLMIDAYVLQKDYPKALEYINKLDSLIDKDPFQDYERGLVYKMMKDTAHAQQSFERLHANMPSFKKGIIELEEIYMGQHEQDKAVHLIKDAKDSNYLNESNLKVLYFYHPDLKKAIEGKS